MSNFALSDKNLEKVYLATMDALGFGATSDEVQQQIDAAIRYYKQRNQTDSYDVQPDWAYFQSLNGLTAFNCWQPAEVARYRANPQWREITQADYYGWPPFEVIGLYEE